MKGSDFLQAFTGKSPAAWEAGVLEAAQRGDLVPWPMVPVVFRDAAGHTLVVNVASDYLAVGETPADAMRMPLTPLTAQKVADALGMLLPTPKMVKTIHEQAAHRLSTGGLVPNKYANLAQYAAQNARIFDELAGRTGLTSGHKKDVVLGNQAKPNKVLIYGWMKPVVPAGVDAAPMMTAPWRIQSYSSVHGTDYVDYSHGIRLISPNATLDGEPVDLAAVMQDPKLAALVSDEGPLRSLRYNVPKGNLSPVAKIPEAPRMVDQGLAWIQEQTLERRD